jgi:hypothetical protein
MNNFDERDLDSANGDGLKATSFESNGGFKRVGLASAHHVPLYRRGNWYDWNRTMQLGGKLLSASALFEGLVRDVNGKRLGEIEDFILDMANGRIEYVVFSFGGLFGLGNKLCAVAPDMLELDEENNCFRLHYDKERVGNAPEFDKSKWPYLSWAPHPSRIYILRGKPHRQMRDNAEEPSVLDG